MLLHIVIAAPRPLLFCELPLLIAIEGAESSFLTVVENIECSSQFENTWRDMSGLSLVVSNKRI